MLPRLYPILDAVLVLRAGYSIEDFASEWYAAGIRFLQYRDKQADDQLFLERAALVRRIFPAGGSRLILNDRTSLVLRLRYDGVHVGQEDLSPGEARELLGPHASIGVSTHGERQLLLADGSAADYLAIGPVFATSSRDNPDPVVGLEGVSAARALTTKPLVAIGGITRSNCASVLQAGADSVAVISDLIPRDGHSIQAVAREFLARVGSV